MQTERATTAKLRIELQKTKDLVREEVVRLREENTKLKSFIKNADVREDVQAAQEAQTEMIREDAKKEQVKYQVDQDTESLVDYLENRGIDSSAEIRTQLANKLGIEKYDLSAEKNIELLNALRATGTANELYEDILRG